MIPDFNTQRTWAFNVDCMEYMKELPDGYFELAIVDPPYGITADHFNCANGCKAQLYSGESTAVRIRKERAALKGAGGLKDRALNVVDSSWDATPPPAKIF